MDKPIEKLQLAVDMTDLTGKPAGTIALDGKIAGKPAKGSARFAMGDTGQRIDDLDFAIGSVRAQGSAGIGANGIVDGRFTIAASNLADLSALILTDIAGRLDATIVLDASNGVQRVAVNGNGAKHRLRRQPARPRRYRCPRHRPGRRAGHRRQGRRSPASNAGSQQIERAAITAKSAGSATDVTLDTALLGASITGRANVAPNGGDMRIRLDAFRAAKGATTMTLSAPANITIANGAVAIDRLALATGGGGATTVSGRAGQTLDLERRYPQPAARPRLAGRAEPGSRRHAVGQRPRHRVRDGASRQLRAQHCTPHQSRYRQSGRRAVRHCGQRNAGRRQRPG